MPGNPGGPYPGIPMDENLILNGRSWSILDLKDLDSEILATG
jgi:hypothetical protein